ncbi:MAG: hypothetical protein ACPLW8_06225, partial [Candidatus Bathyarchaeales archaeon]
LVTERIQYKLQRAVEDPDYRLKLLAEGDPDLDDIIVAALRAVELVFRTAGAAAGVHGLSNHCIVRKQITRDVA